jgi:hypothetical protein
VVNVRRASRNRSTLRFTLRRLFAFPLPLPITYAVALLLNMAAPVEGLETGETELLPGLSGG